MLQHQFAKLLTKKMSVKDLKYQENVTNTSYNNDKKFPNFFCTLWINLPARYNLQKKAATSTQSIVGTIFYQK